MPFVGVDMEDPERVARHRDALSRSVVVAPAEIPEDGATAAFASRLQTLRLRLLALPERVIAEVEGAWRTLGIGDWPVSDEELDRLEMTIEFGERWARGLDDG